MATQEAYLGSIGLFAGPYNPPNYLLCQGQLLPVSKYTALHSLIGTTYGGDGITTFGIPDLRGRVPVGVGQNPATGSSNYTLGQTGGKTSFVLTIAQMPSHNHTATIVTSGGGNLMGQLQIPVKTGLGAGSNDPTNKYLGASGSANMYYAESTPNAALAPVEVNFSGDVTGGSVELQPAGSPAPQAIPLMKSYLVVSYIICVNGVYPPRS